MAYVARSRTLVCLCTAASALISTSALAQTAPAAPRATAWGKTEAILGGSPSALQAILAQQKAIAPLAPAVVQPAGYSVPPMPRTVLAQRSISPAIASGRPDVFGSVALKVEKTPLNARWRRVERARLSGAAGQFAEALTANPVEERLEAVNRYVNGRVRFTDDQRQYGRADFWSTAAETLRLGRGDCEDYAVAKLQMLRRAGISERDLYLVIVKDLISRSDHAVLVVRAAGRMFVLDNGTDRLLDSEQIRDYRPVLTFAAAGTWTHGYRRSTPVTVAAVDDSSPAALAPAAETQRSWSASLLALSTGLSK